jgi:hypothetical protein
VKKAPGADIIKTFYCGNLLPFVLIPPFCVIKLYYLGKYPVMAVNYHTKKFIKLAYGGKLKYCRIYCRILTLEIVGTSVNYRCIFITLATGLKSFVALAKEI